MSPLRHFAILIIFVLLASCSNRTGNSPVVLFTDALDRSVAVPDSVKSIVTLAPSATEIVFASGAAEQLTGVTTADNFPPEIEALPRITAFPSIDYEKILSLSPDLVLASSDVNGPDIAERLSEFSIPVFYLGSASLESIFNNIRIVGTLTGFAERAENQARLLEQSVLQISDLVTAADAPDRTVLVLIGTNELYSFGAGSYVHEMIRSAGGTSITEDIPLAAPVLSEEFVLAQQPDVIILPLGEDFNISELVDTNTWWESLDAYQSGRIHSLDPDVILRPGPRVVDGILKMATVITPEILTPEAIPSAQ